MRVMMVSCALYLWMSKPAEKDLIKVEILGYVYRKEQFLDQSSEKDMKGAKGLPSG